MLLASHLNDLGFAVWAGKPIEASIGWAPKDMPRGKKLPAAVLFFLGEAGVALLVR